ncbi:hypothetical protein HAX54_013944 [Datura stramonium]|uniref:Uncharacterized protein n=1 Tax=Datura stramonium TaxID=4076 RepID=A0ABS8TM74_DATST|nr:hypothetical protein [Datura stramonium]
MDFRSIAGVGIVNWALFQVKKVKRRNADPIWRIAGVMDDDIQRFTSRVWRNADEAPVQFTVGFSHCLKPLLHRQFADQYQRFIALSPIDYWYAQTSTALQRVSSSPRTPHATRRCVAGAAGSLNDGFSSLLFISPLE